MFIPVAEQFRPYLDAAVARLRYLYPAVEFTLFGDGIGVSEGSEVAPERVGRDVQYTLYREKIYAETLPMRRNLIEAITRQ